MYGMEVFKVRSNLVRTVGYMSETNRFGQTFYPGEAEEMFPGGCKCWDDSGDCDWCRAYYGEVD